MRSDSLTRSSSASRITVVPLATEAARASTGSSSITRGITSPAISTPVRSLDSATRSADGSPASSRMFSIRMFAPISRRTSRTPRRVGLMPTPLIVIEALGCAQPATSQRAAALRSHGTLTFTDSSCDLRIVTFSASTARSAPMAVIIRSVWSRDAAGCTTDVSPSAYRPATRIDDLSCALATGISYVIPCRSPPSNTSGASEPSCLAVILAPIRSRGTSIRFIGLRRREASPVMTLMKGCAASRPDSSRMVVPLLLACSTSSGSWRPSGPSPFIRKHSSAWEIGQPVCGSMSAPRDRRQPSIAVRSSPTQKFETCAVPRATVFSRAARCEMDLSPGGATTPSSRCACLTARFMRGACASDGNLTSRPSGPRSLTCGSAR